MSTRILAVRPPSRDYMNCILSVAHSFEEAKGMIKEAEMSGEPFDQLDLPVRNLDEFWEFVEWMRRRHRYPFSIFGYKNVAQFIKIRDKARKEGFDFRS